MALYKVVLKGSYQGQSITNILYYRNGVNVEISGLTVGGTKEVADAVKAIVWTGLRPALPNAYELQQIDSYVYNDQTFDLLYQNPYTVGVQEPGIGGNGATNGPATVAICKFILEARPILLDGPFPPKRGYLAIGPLQDTMVKDDGALNLDGGNQLVWDTVCAVLANNVETILPIPAVFFPVRVHMSRLNNLVPLKIASWSDVQACVMRHFTSFRRSRMPEN